MKRKILWKGMWPTRTWEWERRETFRRRRQETWRQRRKTRRRRASMLDRLMKGRNQTRRSVGPHSRMHTGCSSPTHTDARCRDVNIVDIRKYWYEKNKAESRWNSSGLQGGRRGEFPRPWFWSSPSVVENFVSHPGKKTSPSMVLHLSQGKEGGILFIKIF